MALNPDSVHIWRTPDGHHYLHWETSDPATAVAVEPIDAVAETRELPPGGPGRARISGLPASRRHFFRLRDSYGTEVVAAARGLGLPGGVNFRDFGGYRAADGRRVRWGYLFRSGNLSRLTDEAQAMFTGLAIDVVCDFRREDEQVSDPSLLPSGPRRINLAITPGSQGSALYDARHRLTDAEAMAEAMRDINREFVRSQSDRYAALFSHLLEPRNERCLVHCAAGKDRTGFAAALVLFALGVPQETVLHDYLLTRHYFDATGELGRVREKYDMHHLDDEVLLPMLQVDESYLGAALGVIAEDYGSTEAYLEEALGVGPAERAALAARYLED
ncbi:tyrosine-protein phosphatase [Pseudohaliea rubra]|uniref:Protein tyrosine phosphatase n=1 Tax=Pseudohaliea rubra DSM 19751 TaxID=1265313 RepID=A0A095XSC1_9GAMM|nr:tyrosine-protein phosphatase [Pseudohaliea rubra]KGE02541.1 Protein tyrosine phosphatase [Pseudohaliea rubra DSM 19751]